MAQTETIDNDVCRMLAELAYDYGVRHVVVSPGSRSAPLAVVFHRSKHFCMHTVIDERCAAFMALGMALKSDSPVLLICTSGSALMNYGPALAEAYYRRTALIAVSADRPARWIDQLDSQTMRQYGALATIVRKSIDIPVAASSDTALFAKANREINEALDAATSGRQGPVHINVQLDTPLTRMTMEPPAKRPRLIRTIRPEASPVSFGSVVSSLGDKKVMIVCGDTNTAERTALRSTPMPGCVVVTEVQSNVGIHYNIGSFDRFLTEDPSLAPDVIITMGGSIISSRFKIWLRSLKNLRHISLGFDDNATDTFGCLDTRIECQPQTFLNALRAASTDRDFAKNWADFYTIARTETDRIIAENPVMKIIAVLASKFDGDIHIGNGSAIRYAQMVEWNHKTPLMCNRGISGIDGCTSTALGSALVSNYPTLLITGDMSAAYDIGALAAAPPPPGFRIVVLDNNGGDIFRNISTTSTLPELDRYFVAQPNLPLQALAEAYGYQYFEYNCSSPENSVLELFTAKERPAAILRIIIDPKYTARLL